MWTDEHGSEVLTLQECHRLLAVGLDRGEHGHLGLHDSGAPTVLPVDYTLDGTDVVIRVGDGLYRRLEGDQLVAFQVDGENEPQGVLWSVLVRGYANDAGILPAGTRIPSPEPPVPGTRLVRISADVVTGRRFLKRLAEPAPTAG